MIAFFSNNKITFNDTECKHMAKIQIFSFEYDGCLDKKNLAQDNIFMKNTALISNIRKEQSNFQKSIVLVGSNRQSNTVENRPCFSNIALISKLTCTEFDSFLLDDIYDDEELGETRHFSVNTKAIIYAQMHKISYEHPSDTIVFNFFHGDDLTKLNHHFTKNSHLIPNNINLQFTQYQAPQILQSFLPIQGQGNTDNNYRETTKLMLSIDGQTTNDHQASVMPEKKPFRLANYIVSAPHSSNRETKGEYLSAKFGYHEIIGGRDAQEDALAWKEIPLEHLANLSPVQIGHRLWSTYKELDKPDLRQVGTTASTTIYDAKGSFITATLGDAASFIAIYNNDKALIGVMRLNQITHKPGDELETVRIQQANGYIVEDHHGTLRVNGKTNISRAIGDHSIKGKYGQKLLCSEAHIDITDIEKIAASCNVNKQDIDTIKLIVTCDGFTDAADASQTKEAHEAFLLKCLQKHPNDIPEKDLAVLLTSEALETSLDNISIAIQTISLNSPTSQAIFLGVYDGHGGNQASHFVAKYILPTFTEQCLLEQCDYEAQIHSVNQQKDLYCRDNSDNSNQIIQESSNESSSSSSSNAIFSPYFFKPATNFEVVQVSLLSDALRKSG